MRLRYTSEEMGNLIYEATRDKRIKEKRCVTCGSDQLATKRLCQRCRENVAAADKARDARLQEQGLCRICGVAPVDVREDGTPLSGCRPCLDLAAEKDAARRAERKRAGLQRARPARKTPEKESKLPTVYPKWVNPGATLDERNRQIARLRREAFTLQQCAEAFGISRQRVLQILEAKSA